MEAPASALALREYVRRESSASSGFERIRSVAHALGVGGSDCRAGSRRGACVSHLVCIGSVVTSRYVREHSCALMTCRELVCLVWACHSVETRISQTLTLIFSTALRGDAPLPKTHTTLVLPVLHSWLQRVQCFAECMRARRAGTC